jgi:hydroxymethylpyrimidine/phosphomethylpyrimidine kinase
LRNSRRSIPTALTIAGSDSGGGAGIQADLKTFAALGVHGTTVLTCITAQNSRRVLAIRPCNPSIIARQLEAIFSELTPAAVKIGMVYSGRIIHVVADFLKDRSVPVVLDPVMISTSGRRLLRPEAVRRLCLELIPRATLVTPNVGEAEVLVGKRLQTPEDLRLGAKALHERFGCAVLVKGGHLRDLNEAVDLFFDGTDELLLGAPFVRRIKTHGTGCTYSAAITAFLARNFPLGKAVSEAKQFITQAIVQNQMAGGHHILNWFWRRKV